MFRATMRPSSGELAVSMRHWYFFTLEQVDSFKNYKVCHKMQNITYKRVIRSQENYCVNDTAVRVTSF